MRLGQWKRKRIGIVLALLVFLPILGFTLSNLYLVSPPGKAWFSGEISRRVNLESSIEGASWSPWNGLTVYGLQIRQPGQLRQTIRKPLLRIRKIRIYPDWNALPKRQLRILDIELTEPEAILPIELLSALPREEVIPPALAENPPRAEQTTIPHPTVEATGPPPVIPRAPDPVVASPPSAPNPAPTVWVKIHNGKGSIVSTLSKQPVLAVSSIDGKLPLNGTNVKSRLRIGHVTGGGKLLQKPLQIPVSLENNILKFGDFETSIADLELHALASFALVPGIPFEIVAHVPTRDGSDIQLSETSNVSFGKVAAKGRLQGLLLAPGSWSGQSVAEASNINVRLMGQHGDFDSGRAIMVFRNGALVCPDARLIGETMSILGNASLLRDGRLAGIARVVAPRETLLSFARFSQQSEYPPALTPLHTPQRFALDMQLFGKLGNVYFKPHPNADPVPFGR